MPAASPAEFPGPLVELAEVDPDAETVPDEEPIDDLAMNSQCLYEAQDSEVLPALLFQQIMSKHLPSAVHVELSGPLEYHYRAVETAHKIMYKVGTCQHIRDARETWTLLFCAFMLCRLRNQCLRIRSVSA